MPSKRFVADDVLVLGELDGYPDEPVYEVVDSVAVNLPASIQNDFLANRLLIELGTLTHARRVGFVVHKMLFDLGLPGRIRRRRPAIAFVSYERWPVDRRVPADLNHWPVIPELAVDFVSPTEEIGASMDRLRDYFDAGVRQAWLIHPGPRVVQVFESQIIVRAVREPDEIQCGDILPGIRVPVAAMLPPRT